MPRTVPLAALALALLLCGRAEGAPAVVPGAGCAPGTNFEREGYTVRSARVRSPFSFLRWIRNAINSAQREVSSQDGVPFLYADVTAKVAELESLTFLPDSVDQRVRVSLIVASVENCSDGQVDVVYTVFTSQVAPVLSGTFESARAEKSAPERATGADAEAGRFRLAPRVGYDRAEDLSGGGRLELLLPRAWSEVTSLRSIVADGRASETLHEYSAALAGAKDSASDWLARVDWQLHYLNSSLPTDRFDLRQNRGAAQLAALTRPLGESQLALRFGGLFEGGRLESDARGSLLAPNAVSSSDYASAKLYLGTTTRLDRHVLSASYGIEAGSTRPGRSEPWIKHVVDLAHTVAIPVGEHRALTLESRLAGGLLHVADTVPVNVRFFGGNREEPFMPGDAWTIRSNPVIRSIPANSFSRTNQGAGGTHFLSYNLTASVPIWRKPLVPFELLRDPDFRPLLKTQLDSATSVLQVEYASRDEHFQRVVARARDAQATLASLKAAVEAARKARPGQLEERFVACTRQISGAERRLRPALASSGGAQVGDIAALLSVGEDRLRSVRADCVEALNAELRDPAIAQHGATLEGIRADMEREYALIDQTAATRHAEREMAFVRRTLNTVVDDLNIVSISPVLMLDVAHLGPADSRLGTRYGVGGGLRLTLANSFDLTVGYLANPKRLRGEPSGAFFFSMQFKDLLE